MDRFEYVIGLMSIITGLALADIGMSLHRLMKRRATVRWDWLALLIAAYVSFIIIRYWYQIWSAREAPGVTGLFVFLSLIAENFILFLMAASVLPDEDDYDGRATDLRAFQAGNSIYLWRLFLLYALSWAAHGLYFSGFELTLWRAFVLFVPVLLGAGLAFTRRRGLQALLVLGLVAHEAWWLAHSSFWVT